MSGKHEHKEHHHSHNQTKSDKQRLMFMLSLTTMFFFIEITVGYVTNSMALVADSFHMLSDVVALVIAYVSVCMSPKKWSKNTFGWARAEVLGALVNAVFLCALCFSILVESLKRFYAPERIHDPKLILIVGISGLLVNVIGLFLFKDGGHHGHSHGHSHRHSHIQISTGSEVDLGTLEINEVYSQQNECALDRQTPEPTESDLNSTAKQTTVQLIDKKEKKEVKKMSSQQLNMRGVFLHVLADALGSVIVCISALLIMQYGDENSNEDQLVNLVDPFLSLLMVILIMYSTYPLLKESAMILLQTVPTHIKVDSLQNKLLQEIDGVLAVHEFHVWQLAGDRIIASAHIRCRNLHDYMQIAEQIKTFFHDMGIHSTTIQPEFVDVLDELQTKEDQQNCVLDCPTNQECRPSTCCGPRQLKEAKNGAKNNTTDSLTDIKQSLLPNKRSNNKLDKLDNTVIDMIEQPGEKQEQLDEKKDNKEDV